MSRIEILAQIDVVSLAMRLAKTEHEAAMARGDIFGAGLEFNTLKRELNILCDRLSITKN